MREFIFHQKVNLLFLLLAVVVCVSHIRGVGT
jgi:hypothetical protein